MAPRHVFAALLVASAAYGAAAWSPGVVVFDITPGGSIDATIGAAPYVFLRNELVAVALTDKESGVGFGCLAHPKANGGRCINNTAVYSDPARGTATPMSHAIRVDDDSVIFAASGVNESFVAYVSAQHGMLWRVDRANSTGPVIFDKVTNTLIATIGPSVSPFDGIRAFSVYPGLPSATPMWTMRLTEGGVTPGMNVSSSQFSPQMSVLDTKVWFSYGETLYGVDINTGPAARSKNAIVVRPCGMHSEPRPSPGCPGCVVPFQVNVVAPALSLPGHDLASVVVSGNSPNLHFHQCGLATPGGNATAVRFHTTDASTVDILAPFTFTTNAGATGAKRRHTVFFASARMGASHALLAYDATSGKLLWAAPRSAKDDSSLPTELVQSASVGGDTVVVQINGALAGRIIDSGLDAWAAYPRPPTECSQTPLVELNPTRVYCVNGSAGIVGFQPPSADAGTPPHFLWSVSLPTRGRATGSTLQAFDSFNGVRLLGVGLEGGSFAAADELLPTTAAPTTTAAAPTGTAPSTPAPQPTQTSPATPVPTGGAPPHPSDDDDHMSPGIVVLVVFGTFAGVGVVAGLVFRLWKRRNSRRRGAIDSALSYSGGDGASLAHSTQHASVAAHGPQSGYGSLYV